MSDAALDWVVYLVTIAVGGLETRTPHRHYAAFDWFSAAIQSRI
jgi:hypothetical protein